MTAGSWYSEPFPPGGAVAAKGILSQLGRPNLSLLEVLVREAIQNSWDARSGNSTVYFKIDGWTCPNDQQAAIRRLIESGSPSDGLPLKSALKSRSLSLLVVTDRGTTGLGGPTRADEEFAAHGQRDFVAFVRNVGEPRDKEFGGGTFGFGKSIFFLVSRARTVMVYTRCKTTRGHESRFIGCALGDEYRLRVGKIFRPYTGRHWWGVTRKGVQEPLIGAPADKAARLFGVEPFAGRETGTAVIVIEPELQEPETDMRAIAWAITWFAWPKMVTAKPSMRFEVSWEHKGIDVPNPAQTPPLDAFVAAYRRLGAGELVACPKPAKLLGRLALERQLVRVKRPDYPSSFEPPIRSPVHHVALVRTPQFVVKYFSGDPLAGDIAEYAGVFVADLEVDDAFANAEPPTHDDWVAAQLVGDEKRFVSSLFVRLRDRLRTLARPTTSEIIGSGGIPLGAASAAFASLVASARAAGGNDGGRDKAKGGEGSKSDGAAGSGGGAGPSSIRARQVHSQVGSIEELGEPHYGQFQSERVLLFPFRILRAQPDTQTAAKVEIGVDENHQSEKEAPDGSPMPRVVGWLGPNDEAVLVAKLPTQGRIGQTWNVAVLPVPDTVTVVGLKVEKSSS